MKHRILFALALLCALASPALAQGPIGLCNLTLNTTTGGWNCQAVGPSSQFTSPLQVTVSATTGSLGTVSVSQVSPGFSNQVSLSPTTATIGTVISGSSSQVADTPTITAGAYVSGNCIGGFRSLAIATRNGQSGRLTNFSVFGQSAAISPTLVAYFFDASPASSTCTDRGAFTLSTVDVNKLITSPQAVTVTFAGGSLTPTVGSIAFAPERPFIAGGSTNSGVSTIFYAMVATSSMTPITASDIQVRAGAILN